MTSDDIESVVNELIKMRGKAPDEEMLERKIEELKTKYNMALEVEKEMENSSTLTYTTIPAVIASIMTSANKLNMTCELDSTHNRLRITREFCGSTAKVDVIYSNNCQMWTIEAKLGYEQFTSTYNGKCGGVMLLSTLKNLLNLSWFA